jgi:hypothetical protein
VIALKTGLADITIIIIIIYKDSLPNRVGALTTLTKTDRNAKKFEIRIEKKCSFIDPLHHRQLVSLSGNRPGAI